MNFDKAVNMKLEALVKYRVVNLYISKLNSTENNTVK